MTLALLLLGFPHSENLIDIFFLFIYFVNLVKKHQRNWFIIWLVMIIRESLFIHINKQRWTTVSGLCFRPLKTPISINKSQPKYSPTKPFSPSRSLTTHLLKKSLTSFQVKNRMTPMRLSRNKANNFIKTTWKTLLSCKALKIGPWLLETPPNPWL